MQLWVSLGANSLVTGFLVAYFRLLATDEQQNLLVLINTACVAFAFHFPPTLTNRQVSIVTPS